MHTLTHFTLCPRSRSIRLALAEAGVEVELGEEHDWLWRPEFLALNPAGELPVLECPDGAVLCGTYSISEYLAEVLPSASGRPGIEMLPQDLLERAEVRRLVDWFHGKCERDVTRELLIEKVYGHIVQGSRPPPSAENLRIVRDNLRYHLRYVGHLLAHRRWLAGENASFADLAAAAQLSVADYLGEVPWESHHGAKAWYQRLKSRPSFRALLTDRIPGLPPPPHYADLDF